MKGLVFTEFVEFMEGTFGLELADRVIQESELPSGGAYTTVATYDHGEMVAMLRTLARRTRRPPAELLRSFGRRLFGQLAGAYPELVGGQRSPLAFLQTVETHIHAEVRKLYPDAELPTFECNADGPGRLVLVYRSARGLADLALGMIEGCAAHFGQELEVREEDLSGGARTHVRFTLTAE